MNQKYNRNSIQKYYGLSTDTKPSDCSSGSEFVEIDTGYKYIYDATSDNWTQIQSGSSPSPSITVDSVFSTTSTNPLQNKVIALCLTPMSEEEYDNLQTYDMPVYFIYEDEEDDVQEDVQPLLSNGNQGGQKGYSDSDILKFPDEDDDLILTGDSGNEQQKELAEPIVDTKEDEKQNSKR